MARCKANTKKGTRCRRNATEGSDYCSTHQPAESPEPRESESLWTEELGDTARTLLGLAVCGAIILLGMRRRW